MIASWTRESTAAVPARHLQLQLELLFTTSAALCQTEAFRRGALVGATLNPYRFAESHASARGDPTNEPQMTTTMGKHPEQEIFKQWTRMHEPRVEQCVSD